MTPEYQSKLNDAFRMVIEAAEKKVNSFEYATTEVDSLNAIKHSHNRLHDNYVRDNMTKQKAASTEIAVTAILYMVEFL